MNNTMGFIIGLIFIVIGVAIKYGKLYYLIAGYNTMTEEEKANYNIEKVANLFMWVMVYMGLLMIFGAVLQKCLAIESAQETTFWVSLITGLPYLLIRSNSKDYKNKE